MLVAVGEVYHSGYAESKSHKHAYNNIKGIIEIIYIFSDNGEERNRNLVFIYIGSLIHEEDNTLFGAVSNFYIIPFGIILHFRIELLFKFSRINKVVITCIE